MGLTCSAKSELIGGKPFRHSIFSVLLVFLAVSFPIHRTIVLPIGPVNLSVGDIFIPIAMILLLSRLNVLYVSRLLLVAWGIVLLAVLSLVAPIFQIGFWSQGDFFPSIGQGIGSLIKYIGALAWMVVIYYMVKDNPENNLWFFGVATIITGSVWAAMGFSDALNSGGRVSGPFENPNLYAAYLVFVLFVTASLYSHRPYRGKFLQFFAPITIILCLVGVLISGSRGALLGVVVGGVMFVFVNTLRNRERLFPLGLKGIVGVFALLGVVIIFISGGGSPLGFERFEGSYEAIMDDEEELPGMSNRALRWNLALSMFENSPIVGIGIGQLTHIGQESTGIGETHNTVLSVAGEMGIIGLSLFVLLLAYLLFTIFTSHEHNFGMARMIMGICVIAILVQGIFANVQHFRVLWIAVGLIAALTPPFGRKNNNIYNN
jgi:hypothetical protein